MALVCPHCSRANCADARFCYFDGASLLGTTVGPETARKTFLAPFVFPTGDTCNTYDEFAHGCQRHWNVALDLLHKGFLQSFFGGLGRLDLAAAAQEAAAFPDSERGLDQFLGRLPTSDISLPKLDVQPKLINLGTLKVGVDSHLELNLENQGTRLVFGSISSSCKWLAPTETGESKLFQFRAGAALTIQIKGQHLRGAVKPLEGTLLIESNAGTFKLKVIASVPIVPFPEGALAGARTPRDIAEKAKHAPKQAAPLFESGAVERWYQANGWTYPVQGPASNGLAAVQQFFEALGLSKPPRVFINAATIQLKGKPGARIQHSVQVRTEENRAVYAHAVSAADWLVVKPALMQGACVTLPLEITVPAECVQTLLKVTANGQQRFDIPVEVVAERAHPSPPTPLSQGARGAAAAIIAAAPIPTAQAVSKADLDFSERKSANPQAAAMPTPRFDPVKLLTHLSPLLLLGLFIFALVSLDVFSEKPRQQAQVKEETSEEQAVQGPQEPQFKVVIQDEPDEGPQLIPVARYKIDDEPEERFGKPKLPPVKVEIKDEPGEKGAEAVPIAAAPLVSYALSNPPMAFGISCTDAAGAARFKKLTFDANGTSNTTLVSMNGGKAEFGAGQGKWTRRNQPLDKITPTPGAVRPSHSTWMWGPVAFHQVLEVVPGQPVTVGGVSRRHLDTVLIRWVLHNTDRGPRNVGLRLQLDTLIGDNDGVPFTVPGYSGLVNTFADFRTAKDVPDFIQALERPVLKNPGTVAHLTLKPGSGIEPPSRVSLTRWLNGGSLFKGFATGGGPWNIPVANIDDDSAVVLYWPEKTLKAGELRTIGFAYGLGNVASNDKLGVTLGGAFEPGQNFTVTAYVENPIAGQTLKLELPAGLKRSEGAETQNVAVIAGKTSIVTWKVLVERTGEFKLKVNSSTGLSQAKTISIARADAPTGGKLALDLRGSYEPGEMFTVFGKVTDPVPDQMLTLHLPDGLQKVGGAMTQRVPAPPAGLKESVVQWQVKVEKPGKYPVRVSSSTGIAQTKTITIVQPGRAEGAFEILLKGDFAPGKAFLVSTRVVNPAPDQKLTLVLPDGLELIVGNSTQTALPGELLAWQVKVREAGKFLVGVKSTTGVTQRKTVVIEPPSDQAGRFNFDFTGDIRPGREFTITARVSDPLPAQTLMLTLPKGLQIAKGDLMQAVAPGKESTVAWIVRCTEGGRLPVRIESSTGLSRTKTITLSATSTLFGN